MDVPTTSRINGYGIKIENRDSMFLMLIHLFDIPNVHAHNKFQNGIRRMGASNQRP